AANANFAPPYALLASYLANRSEKLDEALALAEKAAALQPGSTGNQIAVAQVLARMRRYDDAQLVALRARQGAANPQEQQEADRFLAYLQTVRQYSQQRAQERIEDQASAASAPRGRVVARSTGRIDLSSLAQAEGTVTASECGDGELRIQVSSKSGNVQLHGKQVGGP